MNKFYLSPAWRKVRLQALRRAGWRCAECSADLRLEARAQVHHVLDVATHPELALDLSNLRCLCAKCHNTEHDREHGGRRARYDADGFPIGTAWSKRRG